MDADELIYDWNEQPGDHRKGSVDVVDETLRDGLQGFLPRLPTIEERLELLTLSMSLGIEEATVGFPAHKQAFAESLAICAGMARRRSTMRFGLLGRMKRSDIEQIQRIREKSGASVAAWLFLPASTLRRFADDWDCNAVIAMAHSGLGLARELGLPVNFGIEDSARAEPALIESLIEVAAEQEVETVSLCDTVGHLDPQGTARLVGHFRQLITQRSYEIRLDFHNHRDRGLGLANALAAVRSGAARVHGTILGIGERSGNCPLDLLLVNLRTLGLWDKDLLALRSYCEQVSRVCGVPIPPNYPVFGENAFATQAGVHAAAISRAEERANPALAAQVYSGVDPGSIGRDYDVQVGFASGRHNVRFVLDRLGIEPEEQLVNHILEEARQQGRTLTRAEVKLMAEVWLERSKPEPDALVRRSPI